MCGDAPSGEQRDRRGETVGSERRRNLPRVVSRFVLASASADQLSPTSFANFADLLAVVIGYERIERPFSSRAETCATHAQAPKLRPLSARALASEASGFRAHDQVCAGRRSWKSWVATRPCWISPRAKCCTIKDCPAHLQPRLVLLISLSASMLRLQRAGRQSCCIFHVSSRRQTLMSTAPARRVCDTRNRRRRGFLLDARLPWSVRRDDVGA